MRIIEVADEHEMDDKIYYYAKRRYTVKTQTERNVVMSKKSRGSFWFHVLLFLLSLGLFNIIYLMLTLSRSSNDIMIRIVKPEPPVADNSGGLQEEIGEEEKEEEENAQKRRWKQSEVDSSIQYD